MEQKDWEQRLDRVAERVAGTVKDGVRILEDAYEKGKEGLKAEPHVSSADAGVSNAAVAGSAKKGSPRVGWTLVGLGIVWLLHSLGIIDQPIFPILLIALGVYFIARSK